MSPNKAKMDSFDKNSNLFGANINTTLNVIALDIY